MGKTLWRSRTVTDTLGTAGGIVLDDEDTARAVLEDWLHDYYEGLDADDMAWIVDAATGTGIAYADNETLLSGYGIRVEWSAERSAEAVYEYMQDRGEPVTKGPTSVSLGMASQALGDDRGEHGDEALAGAWWRCGDEADVEIAAEYLYAAAYEN